QGHVRQRGECLLQTAIAVPEFHLLVSAARDQAAVLGVAYRLRAAAVGIPGAGLVAVLHLEEADTAILTAGREHVAVGTPADFADALACPAQGKILPAGERLPDK